MVAVVGEERSLAGRGVDGVVVSELGAGQELLPIVLLVVAKGAEILLKDLVDTLGLTVGLRMERGRQVGLDVEEGQEATPEAGCEHFVSVGHDVCGEAVNAVDVLEEEAGNVG
jgi:hypothetical protein